MQQWALKDTIKIIGKELQVFLEKDTVTADENNNEIDGGQDTRRANTAVSIDAVVHHHVPIFTSQNLETESTL